MILFFLLIFWLFFCFVFFCFVKDIVRAVFFLILMFINSVCFLIWLHFYVFGFMLLMIYIGAILILFLFVMMMLNVRSIGLYEISTMEFMNGFCCFIGSCFVMLLYVYYYMEYDFTVFFSWVTLVVENLTVVGWVLYYEYFFLFIMGMCLLVMGMLVPTFLFVGLEVERKVLFRRQESLEQLLRSDSVYLVSLVESLS